MFSFLMKHSKTKKNLKQGQVKDDIVRSSHQKQFTEDYLNSSVDYKLLKIDKSIEIEYEIVEKEIVPENMICPDCGGVTIVGLEFCEKCGGEIISQEI